jgi:hypothetical protein
VRRKTENRAQKICPIQTGPHVAGIARLRLGAEYSGTSTGFTEMPNVLLLPAWRAALSLSLLLVVDLELLAITIAGGRP